MRVAVASDDRSTVAAHFGRTRGFLVFDVDRGEAKLDGYRAVDLSQHACACGAEERPSRHQRVIDVLEGCDSVIARVMGPHMYDDLHACGIDVVLTDIEDARTAIDLFMQRALPERLELGCF